MPEERALDLTSQRVREAFRGDAVSLEWIVARFTPLLLAQASYRMSHRLRRYVEPDDVVAEAWLVALPKLHELASAPGRSTPRLLAFLSTTILRIINRTLEKQIRQHELQSGPDPFTSSGGPDPMQRHAAPITGVVTRAVRNEASLAIASSLSKLKKEDLEIIILRGIEGVSNEEAAQVLDVLETTVSHRYRRALKKLRDELPGSILDELTDD